MGRLKERLMAREEKLNAGRFPELTRQKDDPIRYEILFTRLAGLVQNARETARRISASPVVREMGECVFALFTPEGESVCFSNGLLLHIASLGGTVKWMIHHDYEEEVGINEGDYFMNNDPHIGGAHSADQATVTPIFHQGLIVGWAGGLVHVLETGATEPGGSSPSAISRYDEGIFWPCVKVAEKEKLKKDLENIVIRGTRIPLYWLMDSRACMAGDRLIKEGLIGLIEEFGLTFYLETIYEFIEDSRRAAQKKIRTVLFPGRYSQVGFHDLQNKEMPVRRQRDYNIRIPCETVITPEGRMRIDFDGASPPGHHPNNASLPCLTGNLINCLIQYLFYDLKPNQGLFQAFEMKVPTSVLNPPLEAATAIWSTAISATEGNILNIAKAYYPMGFREEVSAGFFAGNGMLTGGLDQYGRPFGTLNFEGACAGTGAMGAFDGQHTCYAAFNSEGDFSDVEIWEKIIPQMWLGRRVRIDSGGFGKYQGGGAIETLYFHEHSDQTVMGAVLPFHKVFMIPGLMGGYPSACAYHWYATDTDLRERIDRQDPLPHSGGDDPSRPEWLDMIAGETRLLPGQVSSRPVKRYDLWQNFTMGGGGFGDPIERDPQWVKRDLDDAIITPHAVRSVYGVVIDEDRGEINPEETEDLRNQIRAGRREKGLPVREYLARERERILSGDLPEMAVSCLNECLAHSKKFQSQFIRSWDLDPSFTRIKTPDTC